MRANYLEVISANLIIVWAEKLNRETILERQLRTSKKATQII